MLARPAVLLTATTPEPRLPRFAQFWCDASPFRINTSKSVSKQTTLTLFRMNTYGKHTGGEGTILPSSNLLLVTRHWTQVLSFHILPHSFAYFCVHSKFNPFLFKRFLTLCQEKTRGVGQTKNGGALPAVMGASAERAYRLQERRSLTVLRSPRISTILRSPGISTVLRSPRISTVLRSSRTLLRFSFPAVEAEGAYSLEISLDALAQWCSPRVPQTAPPPVPSAEYSLACTWYCQNGDPNACY